MAQFTIYKSTDASAPVLTGENGKLVDLLTACLVNGYGSKAAAGWTREFTDTGKAVYRPGAGSRLYYRVNDAAAGSGGAKEALVRGFEGMTDVDTGTGPFPQTAQSALTQNGYIIRKSATASNAARSWKVFADSRTAYVLVSTGDVSGFSMGVMVGDIYSYVPGDAYHGAVIARYLENSGLYVGAEAFGTVSVVFNVNLSGHSIARPGTQLGGSPLFSKHADAWKSNNKVGFRGEVPFPNPADGGIYLAPLVVSSYNAGIRGVLRGIYTPMHDLVYFAEGNTFSGGGGQEGKTFEVLSTTLGDATNSGGIAIGETSDTVLTN